MISVKKIEKQDDLTAAHLVWVREIERGNVKHQAEWMSPKKGRKFQLKPC